MVLTHQQEPSKAYILAGIFTLSLRLIVGWTYFSAFWRRLVFENKLIADGTDTLEKNSIIFFPIPLASNRLLTWISTPDLLWWANGYFHISRRHRRVTLYARFLHTINEYRRIQSGIRHSF